MNFKKYADNDYEAVCDFLIELNARDTSHIIGTGRDLSGCMSIRNSIRI